MNLPIVLGLQGTYPILIASTNLLQERAGHTELSIYLMQIANLVPAA